MVRHNLRRSPVFLLLWGPALNKLAPCRCVGAVAGMVGARVGEHWARHPTITVVRNLVTRMKSSPSPGPTATATSSQPPNTAVVSTDGTAAISGPARHETPSWDRNSQLGKLP